MIEQLQKLIIRTFTTLGCLCIVSGLALPKLIKFEHNDVVKLDVSQKQVTNVKSNEIKLKDVTIELGSSLSSDSHDYLKNPNDIQESIIKQLKLDISSVNIKEEGTYNYTITYNKKIYNGFVTVIPKALPKIDNISLNELSFEVNEQLPKEISFYIKDKLPAEVLSAARLDLSNVNISIPGKYLYSISYNKNLYTSTITIYEPKLSKDNSVNTKKEN